MTYIVSLTLVVEIDGVTELKERFLNLLREMNKPDACNLYVQMAHELLIDNYVALLHFNKIYYNAVHYILPHSQNKSSHSNLSLASLLH